MISKIIASAIVLWTSIPQGKQIPVPPPPEVQPQQVQPQQVQPQQVQPQQTLPSIFLPRLKCVDTGLGNWGRQTQDVSVGKAVYTSRLYMGPGNATASMTCQLQPNEGGVNFQTLKLGFGMRDNDAGSPQAIVNLYLDGKPAESRRVSPGQPASILRDLAEVKNLSLEVVCTNSSRICDRVYFWDASLEYTFLPRQ